MTNGQITALAKEAARNAYDAHAGTGLGMPDASIAHDFIRNMQWEDAGTDAEAIAVWDSLTLTDAEWPIFEAEYQLELALLSLAEVAQ